MLVKLDGWIGARDVPYAWAFIALVIAGLFAWLATARKGSNGNQELLAGFAVGASAFLSFGLGLALDPGLYALVAALQAFGLSLLYYRIRLFVLKALHTAYCCVYVLLLVVGQVMHGAHFGLWHGRVASGRSALRFRSTRRARTATKCSANSTARSTSGKSARVGGQGCPERVAQSFISS
jgi:hypothetical protein